MRSITCASVLVALGVLQVVVAEPITLSLQRRQAPNQNWRRHGGDKSSISVPLTDFYDHADFQWYTTIEVGTPPQEFVIVDTGSNVLLIPGTNCTTCGDNPLFDPSRSSTFIEQSPETLNFSFATGATDQPLKDNAAGVSGQAVSDTVSINGGTVENQQFLLANFYDTELLEIPLGGVFGFGPGTTGVNGSWLYNLAATGRIPSAVISLYLASGRPNSDGEMTIGGTGPSRYRGKIDYVGMQAIQGGWFLDTPTFKVNGKVIPSSNQNVTNLDTGTAYVLTPDVETAAEAYAAISPEIKRINDLGVWGAPCKVMQKLCPDLNFSFSDGNGTISMSIPRNSFNLGPLPDQPDICQGVLVDPGTTGIDFWVIGSPVFKGSYTVWDAENLRFGVAKLRRW